MLKSEETTHLADVAPPVIQTIWSFTIIFIFCELGQMVTNQFDTFCEELCEIDWNLLPNSAQKMLLIFLGHAQSSTYIRSYGGILCTRDSFEKVIDSIYDGNFNERRKP